MNHLPEDGLLVGPHDISCVYLAPSPGEAMWPRPKGVSLFIRKFWSVIYAPDFTRSPGGAAPIDLQGTPRVRTRLST